MPGIIALGRNTEHITSVMESEWGRLFANWGNVPATADGKGWNVVGQPSQDLVRRGVKHFTEGLRLVGMAVAESPEIQARKRRSASAL